MRAWYSPGIPLPDARLAFETALVRHFEIQYAMDNVVVVDASTSPFGTLSATIYGFEGPNGGALEVAITLDDKGGEDDEGDDEGDDEVCRRGFTHRVQQFDPLPYEELDPLRVFCAYLLCFWVLL
ncbi:hypothetical protein PC9H_010142 [Pleurotus ostreatus]|uniref:Uncharacterized protein n=1 Tax=Pleurotus ostreatus TaxID=5322 RepID=A0A8H6ZS06_PLEOS|nr:uncharacterized protein PC9H_010142 [Pleurotus ostreatus]KAF7424831.1 hypothetical protein PC9H_010142 [Pleurotus ostreatus]KAJ8692153.1 hypothetical protein PTI98_009491 [Pleurotus ostreatus]